LIFSQCLTKNNAVSVGNIHKLTQPKAVIDHTLTKETEEITETPLVLHGTSGISSFDMKMIIKCRTAKCNIGTLPRQTWEHTLRKESGVQSEAFDRLTLTKKVLQTIQSAASQ